MRCIFFSRFQSWRIIPIVMISALGSGSLKKSPEAVPMRSLSPAARNVFLGDRLDGRRVERSAVQVRMSLRDLNTQQAGRSADIAEGLELGKIELGEECFEVDAREAGHRAHELFQSG